jgi:hypothetical protein
MANELEKAQAQFQAGEYKRAVDTLWEVTFTGDHAEMDARRLIALAAQLQEVTQGGARRDCDEHIARAERYLEVAGGPEVLARREKQARSRLEESVRLARDARAAGLTWLEIRSSEDVIAAEMGDALSADGHAMAAAPQGTIDAVEAEGWRLEHVAPFFRPTKVQTSVLRGAEYFMGGEVIEGEEIHLYLFRRADGGPGGPD